MPRRRIALTGGGTLGSVTPLLALVEYARERQLPYDFYWIGTSEGPERAIVESYAIPFMAIVSDKLRRYASLQLMLLPWRLTRGFFQSLQLLKNIRPNAVVTAGAYVSVPVVVAAWLRRIPVAVHEMDKQQGLAIALMAPLASLHTSVWPRPKAETVGNFVRPSLLRARRENGYQRFGIPVKEPVMLVTGGGTGAQWLNDMIWSTLDELCTETWVIHLVGRGKLSHQVQHQRYKQQEYATDDMAELLAMATIVVSRAGMGILSDLGALAKAAIIIPLPHSHQERNAEVVEAKTAGVVMRQSVMTKEIFVRSVLSLLRDTKRAQALGQALHELIPDGLPKFMAKLERLW